jgi:hypothetical protein
VQDLVVANDPHQRLDIDEHLAHAEHHDAEALGERRFEERGGAHVEGGEGHGWLAGRTYRRSR